MAKVIWTDPALNELDAIADYISLDKPEAARLWVQKVFKKVSRLGRFPYLGTCPSELKGLPYRQLVISPCRIFYRFEKGKIYIVSIFQSKRILKKDSFN
jgi:toxin ParE1/3/4